MAIAVSERSVAFFGLFGRTRRNRQRVEALHAAIVSAARSVAFYRDGGIPDTFEGRFDLLTLHLCLVARALRAEPAPGPDMAQDLIDCAFRHFDANLREAGVGDLTVPKRMKVLASAFLGRSTAYDEALRQKDLPALASALQRNLYGTVTPPEGALESVVAYVNAATSALASSSITTMEAEALPWPPLDFSHHRSGESIS
jgi:cytochrome b pre-mRNA-processing protein 3